MTTLPRYDRLDPMRSWTQTWEAHGRLPWSCCAKVFAQVQGVQRDLSLPAKSIEVESCRFRISCEMIRPPRNSWKWNLSKKNMGFCHPTSPFCMRFFEVNMSQIYQFDMPCGIWYLSPPSPSPSPTLPQDLPPWDTVNQCDPRLTTTPRPWIRCKSFVAKSCKMLVGNGHPMEKQPSLTNIAPENGWLEYFFVSFWDCLFSGTNC